MKRMILAIAIMVLLTITVVVNSFFITGVIKQIIEYVSQLPDNAEDFGDGSSSMPIIQSIEQRWEKTHEILDLSLQVSESRDICLLIAELRVFAEAGEFIKFHSAVERLSVLLEHLYDSEELSLRSIL